MFAFRRVLAGIIIAVATTITVVVQAVLFPIAAWLQPRRDPQETRNGFHR